MRGGGLSHREEELMSAAESVMANLGDAHLERMWTGIPRVALSWPFLVPRDHTTISTERPGCAPPKSSQIIRLHGN